MDSEAYLLIISVKNSCPFPITYLPVVLCFVTDIQLLFLWSYISFVSVVIFRHCLRSLRLLLLAIPRTGTVRSSVNAHRSTARHSVHISVIYNGFES